MSVANLFRKKGPILQESKRAKKEYEKESSSSEVLKHHDLSYIVHTHIIVVTSLVLNIYRPQWHINMNRVAYDKFKSC